VKLFKTSNGNYVEDGGKHFRVPESNFDALVVHENLGAYLRSVVEAGKPSTDFSSAQILAPIGNQEVWAAGVTYFRSRSARMAESKDAGGGDFYDRVYTAERIGKRREEELAGVRKRRPGRAAQRDSRGGFRTACQYLVLLAGEVQFHIGIARQALITEGCEAAPAQHEARFHRNSDPDARGVQGIELDVLHLPDLHTAQGNIGTNPKSGH